MKKVTKMISFSFMINCFIGTSSNAMFSQPFYEMISPKEPYFFVKGNISPTPVKNKIIEKLRGINISNKSNWLFENCANLSELIEKYNEKHNCDIFTTLWDVINHSENEAPISWRLEPSGVQDKKIFTKDPFSKNYMGGLFGVFKNSSDYAFRTVSGTSVVYKILILNYEIIINLNNDGKGEISNVAYKELKPHGAFDISEFLKPIKFDNKDVENLLKEPIKFNLSPEERVWVNGLIDKCK